MATYAAPGSDGAKMAYQSRYDHWIGGEYVAPQRGQYFENPTPVTGETFTEDIGDDNPVAIYVPGANAHGYEALTDCLFCYFVTEEYDAEDPDEHGVPWNDPRVAGLWSTTTPILSARDTV